MLRCCLIFTLVVVYCADLRAVDPDCYPGRFVSIFNGRNLDGWKGATETYVVDRGIIRSLPDKGGNLVTEKEYSDFIFRFDFRLTEGSNNGIGLRVPFGAHAATQGMEVQIIDNNAAKYRTLKPYQYHGSIYGLVGAQTGHLKPVGQWNHQEIRCIGKQVTVILNGHVIVDADIAEAYAQGPLDDREHPGVEQTSGHLGLLGHKSVVEFRNLCIKEVNVLP